MSPPFLCRDNYASNCKELDNTILLFITALLPLPNKPSVVLACRNTTSFVVGIEKG